MEKLYAIIDELSPAYVQFWKEICEIETPSQDKAALDRLVDKLQAHAEALGCLVTREAFEKAGLSLSGTSPDGQLVETVELTERPFHVGVQYHPEFKSRPNHTHPLFRGFIEAAIKYRDEL